ncbi:Sugar phosphate isomerase/epimerase [Saccharopolyspora antimicrobica]|uniref:Sugar phosphate isomerase/epimerase n=1 Tax=Saccharopolyspora antimicrobica TaxID=455193 RepID=A0A1I4RCH3_9PSEU|nr:sugar phosphate isomerase/epimerase family protein [Saccharopolyspora antimicrobica]RKT88064.1 sugar phosphate isomerase/epimerase [Saccharopolyspora antimicrobica]SFM49994.1 Sugar phosphate isomerase/epimerase [Saccharopolyspora antimicrobica]
MTTDIPSAIPARIPTPEPGDPRLARLALNQRTTANWSLPEAVRGCAEAGIGAIGVWREPLAETGLAQAARMIADAGLRVSSLCRGGFFTTGSALDDNIAALDEAAALSCPTLVLVPGGLPEGSRDLHGARQRVAEAIAELVPHAQARGVRLGIEPMHPIFAADRGVISTLAQALDLAEAHPPEAVGVVVDTFHLWWEPGVLDQIARAGPRIAAYQVSDWITPLPPDALLSRGVVGDGHIDFAAFTRAVTAAGYRGDVEVEIFNAEVWAAPGARVLATCARRHAELLAPHLPREGPST